MLHYLRQTAPLDRIFRGAQVDLLVLGREDVQSVVPSDPYIVISITDPDREIAELAESPLRKAVLRLSFDDVAGVTNPILLPFVSPRDIPMSPEHAEQLLAFIQENRTAARLIVCHCEMGVSRSAAVAAALSQILNQDDTFFFTNYLPNRWVYNLLLEQWELVSRP